MRTSSAYIGSFPIPEVNPAASTRLYSTPKRSTPMSSSKIVWAYTWFDHCEEQTPAKVLIEQGGGRCLQQHQDSTAPKRLPRSRHVITFVDVRHGAIRASPRVSSIIDAGPLLHRPHQTVMDGTWERRPTMDGIGAGMVLHRRDHSGSFPADVKRRSAGG